MTQQYDASEIELRKKVDEKRKELDEKEAEISTSFTSKRKVKNY